LIDGSGRTEVAPNTQILRDSVFGHAVADEVLDCFSADVEKTYGDEKLVKWDKNRDLADTSKLMAIFVCDSGEVPGYGRLLGSHRRQRQFFGECGHLDFGNSTYAEMP
jgi:hypothetical protein